MIDIENNFQVLMMVASNYTITKDLYDEFLQLYYDKYPDLDLNCFKLITLYCTKKLSKVPLISYIIKVINDFKNRGINEFKTLEAYLIPSKKKKEEIIPDWLETWYKENVNDN